MVDLARGKPVISSVGLIESAADFALAQTPHLLSVLDVGCGDGALLHEIALRVPYAERYVGVDPDRSVLESARRRPDGRIDYLDAQAVELPFADGSFDLVIALRSAHLWADQEEGLRELRRVLEPRGRIVIVDRLADSVRGAGRIRSRRALRSAAQRAGLTLVGTEIVTRRLAVFPGVRGFVLIP